MDEGKHRNIFYYYNINPIFVMYGGRVEKSFKQQSQNYEIENIYSV